MSTNKANRDQNLNADKVKFGLHVKKHREQKGYTQQELAEMIGLTPKSISFIERGINYPTQENIFKLASLLDMSLDEFVFSYSRFRETICVPEINDMLQKLTPAEQELVINTIKAICDSIGKGK